MSPDLPDATFAASADPARRAILARLASGEATVTELAAPFHMSQPAISKHLKVPERTGLISRGRDAQRRPCGLEARPLKAATDWLENYRGYREESHERLDTLLDELKSKEDGSGRVLSAIPTATAGECSRYPPAAESRSGRPGHRAGRSTPAPHDRCRWWLIADTVPIQKSSRR